MTLVGWACYDAAVSCAAIAAGQRVADAALQSAMIGTAHDSVFKGSQDDQLAGADAPQQQSSCEAGEGRQQHLEEAAALAMEPAASDCSTLSHHGPTSGPPPIARREHALRRGRRMRRDAHPEPEPYVDAARFFGGSK